MYIHLLRSDWWCKPVQTDDVHAPPVGLLDWLPATVPGTVQQDLLAAGLIPDPYIGMHEKDIQWVGELDWLYRCTFDLPDEVAAAPTIDLVCAGLDTEATLWLNDHEVITSTNMFIPQRAEVTRWLRPQGNEIRIYFKSPWAAGKAHEAQGGKLTHWNGDASRLYMRKAQYHYGWDWGPTILTIGPWLPIQLEAYTARIVDLHCPAELAADLQHATLPIHVELSLPQQLDDARLEVSVSDPSGRVIATHTLPVSGPQLTQNVEITAPQLWWPHGYGDQPRYHVQTTLWSGEQRCDERMLRLGLRRVELVRRPLQDVEGESFFFRINNTPIFCGGVNWIPADLFLTRPSEETYRTWLTLAIDANMVMVRVWGGGIYEMDSFYEICDELGLLVWQDFMFACGLYPADMEFQESIRLEAEAQVTRLRRYSSVVLWCGNNEDYWISRLTGHYTPSVPPGSDTQFPARTIYEQLLPELCARLDPTRPYWPGSPYGGADPNGGTQGDRHVWEIWNEPVDRYQNYAYWRGRFVSEFGMLSAPAPETIASFTTPAERYLLSPTIAWHNKAEHAERRVNFYLSTLGREPRDLDEYIYLTQLVQAEALSWALRGWRRYWRGEGREEVAGALIWQLNDCWPALSWALVDSALRLKPAYYTVRRALAPIALGAMRSHETGAALWAMNNGAAVEEVEVTISRWTLDGKQRGSTSWHGRLPANGAIELPEQPLASDEVLGARLLVDGAVVARVALWPEHVQGSDPHVQIRHLDDDRLQVSVDAPARGVWLMAGDQVNWSDNRLDILPDDPHEIQAEGAGQITVRCFS